MIYKVNDKKLKQTIDADYQGTAKRNAYQGSEGFDFLRKNDRGHWITGFNVYSNDPTEDEKTLIDDLAEISKLTQKDFDYTNPDNEFLLKFRLYKYYSDGSMPLYNTSNPLDFFCIKASIANGTIAPDLESVGKGNWTKTTFYFTCEEKENVRKRSISKLRNSIGALLETNSKSREWLLCMAYKLNHVTKSQHTDEVLYNIINEKKDKLKSEEELIEFERKLKTPNSEIELLFISRTAINDKYLVYDIDSHEYLFEGIKLGKGKEEVTKALSLKENKDIYIKLKQKIYKDYQV